jgi:hypothetical protein
MARFDEFDHCVIKVNDLLLAEHFYSTVLGEILGSCEITQKSNMTTNDLILSNKQASKRAALDGREHSVAASHGGVKFGEALIPLFLNQDHIQEPPPELPVTPEQMEKAVVVLRRNRVAFMGPVEYAPPCPAERSIYFKDPSSNFLELSVPRREAE